MNLAVLAPAWLAALFALLLVAAAVQDAARMRISNLIVAGVLLAAIVAAAVVGPQLQLWRNVAVFAVLLGLGIPLFASGKLGGGDVKLLAATGLWFDFSGALRMLLAVFLCGGLLAIFTLSIRLFDWSEAARGRVVMLRAGAGIPYAVAIGTGALLSVFLQRSL